VLHPGICPHASAAAVLTIVVVPQLSFVTGRGEEEFCKAAFLLKPYIYWLKMVQKPRLVWFWYGWRARSSISGCICSVVLAWLFVRAS
jgi:hypothetical protein